MNRSLAGPQAALSVEMADVLRRIARAGRPAFHDLTPQQARTAYAAGAGVLELPALPMARSQTLQIPSRDGAQLHAMLWDPRAPTSPGDRHPPRPVLLYFHGGGFMIGSVQTHALLCQRLAALADCAVVAVDYRLAPEHRFPTAHNDAWDALQWLHAQAPGLGLNPQRMAVGGDSAGGTLATASALHARDAGLPLVLQLLFYPGCSPHQDWPSHGIYANGFMLEREGIDYFFSHYLQTASDRQNWRFAPLVAPELEGVAPAWIGLAECDPLVDEGLAYADRLRFEGVAVDLEIYRGVVHGFVQMGRAIPQAQQAHAHAAQALRQAFQTEMH